MVLHFKDTSLLSCWVPLTPDNYVHLLCILYNCKFVPVFFLHFPLCCNHVFDMPVKSNSEHKHMCAHTHTHFAILEKLSIAKYSVIRPVFVLAVINAPLETQCQIIKIDAGTQCSEVCA